MQEHEAQVEALLVGGGGAVNAADDPRSGAFSLWAFLSCCPLAGASVPAVMLWNLTIAILSGIRILSIELVPLGVQERGLNKRGSELSSKGCKLFGT